MKRGKRAAKAASGSGSARRKRRRKYQVGAVLALAGAWPAIAVGQQFTLPGHFDVSPTGAATYSLPIAVPPGTAGMVPSLSLDYDSQKGNGVVGVGWSLGGLPAITRCPETLAQNGVSGGVTYTASDRFCLDGEQLIAINGTYGADGTEYRTEIDGFSRIISHGTAGNGPAWFEVHTKSGQIMEFGNTTDSQILAQGTTTARTWALDKVTDTKGNYFTVTYTVDSTNGEAYPAEIDYTGNAGAGLQPYDAVKFLYATRSDTLPTYQAGSLQDITQRLTDIETYASGALVNDYRLAYQQSPSTQRSRLTSVTLCDGSSPASCLPATTFGWQDIQLSFGSTSAWTNCFIDGTPGGTYTTPSGDCIGQIWGDNNSTPRFLGDVTGGGLPDIVGFNANGVWVGLNSGSGFAEEQHWNSSSSFATQVCTWGGYDGTVETCTNYWDDTDPRFVTDVNGDGKADIVEFGDSGVEVALSTGSGLGTPQKWISAYGRNAGGWSSQNTYPRFLVDVNGDGLPDIVGFASAGVDVSLNTGSGFAAAQEWNANFGTNEGYTSESAYPRYLADMNGDGLPDIVAFTCCGVEVALNTGSGFAAPQTWTTSFGNWPYDGYPVFLADVNGDGLPDVVGEADNGLYVAINTGKSFLSTQQWSSSFGDWAADGYPVFLADVNGDGRDDAIGFSSTGAYVALSTGTSFLPVQQWSSTSFLGTPNFASDANGDGLANPMTFDQNDVYAATTGAKKAPDVITSITTGLGATTSITYAPLTNGSVYTKDNNATYPVEDIQDAMYVVSGVSASNGVGGTYSSTYTYAGAKVNLEGLGFLGFGQMGVKDLQTGIQQTTNYLQSFPYIGKVASLTKALGSQTLNQTANTYEFNNASGAASVPTPIASGAPYNVSLLQSVVSSWDLDGTALPAVTTSFQYDAYGNPTQVTVSTPDGYSKTTTNTYSNDTTNWFLGRLTGASVTSAAP